MTESNLVAHARSELSRLDIGPEEAEGYLRVIQAFADLGCSGSQAAWAIPVLNELLKFGNLTPLTDGPDEWQWHGKDVWQSRRNPEAFSNDGGKTYYLLSEGGHDGHREPLHTTQGVAA